MQKLIAAIAAVMFAVSSSAALAASHAGGKMDDKDKKADVKKTDAKKKDDKKKDEKK